MKKLALIILSFIVLSCSANDANNETGDNASELRTVNLTVDGIERSFVLYLPEGYNNAGNMPLIFVIHGGGGTPEFMLNTIDFREIADRDKVVLVYPSGIDDHWNDGRPTEPNLLGIDDVNFFNEMCDLMIADYSVDSTKLYATGISNGGSMSSRLGCELSDRIASIAVVAATIEENTVFSNCNPSIPVPAIYIHGTLDFYVPFLGGTMTVGAGGNVVSHFEAIAKWVSINNCDILPIITDLPDITDDGTTIKERKYLNGINGSEVVSYVIANGGHTWPSGVEDIPEALVGITSKDMDANEVIWEFFKKFRKI